jgi:hypothetical protein
VIAFTLGYMRRWRHRDSLEPMTCEHGHDFVVLHGEVIWTGQFCVLCDRWLRGKDASPVRAVAG